MFTLGGGTKVFLATGATDLRRGFSLYTLIEHQLGCSRPLGGDVYVFTNRRRDLVKLFWFAEGGMHVLAKRLQTGTFRWPEAGEQTVPLTSAELQLLLNGIDLRQTRSRRWWRPGSAPPAPVQAAGGSATAGRP
jgi:transposase